MPHREKNEMLSRLVYRLLPVQVAIVAVGSINSIVDGVVAGRFIDASSVGVIGLYYSMVRILEAAGSVLLGGVSVLSGKYLGSGRIDKTRGVCSLGVMWALIIGAALTLFSLAAPYVMAGMLGASEELKEPLVHYIRGYAVGIIPQLVAQQLAATLQLERKEKLGQLGIVVMIIVNVVMDLFLIVVLDMGIGGLALATSVANWAYFLVVVTHFFSKKAQLVPSAKHVSWRETGMMLKTGMPNALLVACLAVRSVIVNRILLGVAGEDGLSALSSFNMISGLILAVALGVGGLMRMLASVFIGEENREGLTGLVRLLLTRVMLIMVAIAVLVFLLAPALASIFFPDCTSAVFEMTSQLIRIFSFGVPLTLICIVFANYYQASGKRVFVNLVSLVDGVLGVVGFALLLSPSMGVLGVWWSFPLSLVVTALFSLSYPVVYNRRIPRTVDEWLMLPPEFGAGDRLVLRLHRMEDVTRTAAEVQAFCTDHGFDTKTAAHAGLCLEEMAGNIVEHGFEKDRKSHQVEIQVVPKEQEVVLRIKDDCIPFNPQELYEMAASPEDPLSNVGIRLVYGIAEEVNYQNLLGLNVLTVSLADKEVFPCRTAETVVK